MNYKVGTKINLKEKQPSLLNKTLNMAFSIGIGGLAFYGILDLVLNSYGM